MATATSLTLRAVLSQAGRVVRIELAPGFSTTALIDKVRRLR